MVKNTHLPIIWVALFALLLVATFLRLWNFESTLQFLGDQGRDALIAKRILVDHRPVLIGPVTSTGNMYLGPLYYYFMVPFLAVTYPSPLGPAYAIAFFSILAVFLLYYLGQELVGKRAAFLGTIFFSLSAVAVTYSRFSWNPNLAPFVAVILLWATYRAVKKSPWYFVLATVCISVLMQLHYVTLLVVPTTGIFWLLSLRNILKDEQRTGLRIFILSTLASVLVFIAFLAPLVLFDLRHDFLNLRSLLSFLTEDSGGFNHDKSVLKVMRILQETHGRSLQVLAEMYIGKLRSLNTIVVLSIAACLSLWAFQRKQEHQLGYQILLSYVAVSTIGLAFYQSSVFYHYVAFLYPITFLIYGVMIDKLAQRKLGKVIGAFFLFGFTIWNLQNMPFKPLSWQVSDIQSAAQAITDRVKPGEKYNIVLLTGTGDIEGQNYRYFLDTSDKPPLVKEEWGKTDTLFIINEDKKLAKVVDSPIYEIVVFPNKTPSEVYTIPNGPEITILRR
jgi:4-amino-4-deoxy-L-arabinose transferase-like glycosyltransferase